MEEDDFDDDDEDDDEDDEGPIYPDRRSEETEFGGVEMITPRRMFKGAKNVETVKDCWFTSIHRSRRTVCARN
jgi:nuclear receptor interaction protein